MTKSQTPIEQHSQPYSFNKKGRPSLKTKYTGVPTGVNIDDKTKEFFRRGIQLYFETGECKTLKDAWLRTLMTFFNVGEEEHDGIKIPILPPSEKLPTLAQFRYWYKKERDLKYIIISHE